MADHYPMLRLERLVRYLSAIQVEDKPRKRLEIYKVFLEVDGFPLHIFSDSAFRIKSDSSICRDEIRHLEKRIEEDEFIDTLKGVLKFAAVASVALGTGYILPYIMQNVPGLFELASMIQLLSIFLAICAGCIIAFPGMFVLPILILPGLMTLGKRSVNHIQRRYSNNIPKVESAEQDTNGCMSVVSEESLQGQMSLDCDNGE